MTKGEWTIRERASNVAAGKCRCGGKRVRGRRQCRRCLNHDKKRRVRATKEGLCGNCGTRPALDGRRSCRRCRDRMRDQDRMARALYRAIVARGLDPQTFLTIVTGK